MKRKIVSLLGCTVMLSMLMAGCGSSDSGSDSEEQTSGTKDKIVIGTSSVSKDLAESGREELENMGYEVEIKVFDDYVLPNDALVEGSVDANIYQHEPYMDNYNESNGTNIVMLSPKLWNYYSGLYSVKADSLEELPDGGPIGIAEDASNISEQLQELQEAGLITLNDKPSSGEFFTLADVIDNPHGYEIITGGGNKYQNMEDFTALIGTSNTMAEAGIDPTEHLLKKFVDNELAEGMCVMEENQDAEWVKDLMTAYTSDAAKENVPASTGFEPAEEE
nr:MetQ/NlpA family ABC transporter substrate-binding protein [uncultured Merdimonas sp.]